MPGLYQIVDGPIEIEAAIQAVSGPDRGAIATFIGTTRDHHDGRPVQSLEYHAYVPMAEAVMRQIGEEIAARFGTPHVAILHRIGRVAIGDPSVIIAVAAAHRREALAACAHAIERLKEIVPIWKKEHFAGSAIWVEGPEPPGPSS